MEMGWGTDKDEKGKKGGCTMTFLLISAQVKSPCVHTVVYMLSHFCPGIQQGFIPLECPCYDLSGRGEMWTWWSPWGSAGLVQQASAQGVGEGSGLNIQHWPTGFHLLHRMGKGSGWRGDRHQCE